MGLVVQKYGGSSVADAEGVKRVAKRIVETRKAGHDVVVVVSAMGDTTDELIDLAEQVSPLPPGRTFCCTSGNGACSEPGMTPCF
ncbi:MAG: amino acid kinase family protein, partial [Actinomycetes bacterium]